MRFFLSHFHGLALVSARLLDWFARFEQFTLKAFCHPELVEGSAPARVAIISRRLILRQAQDDGFFRVGISRRPKLSPL